MTDDDKLHSIRSKVKSSQDQLKKNSDENSSEGFTWSMVSRNDGASGAQFDDDKLRFVGKNLENGKFAKENFAGANFSVANLTGVDFSGANLRGVDFSGANLTGANLCGADLSGAILSGAVLHNTDFSKAKLNGVKLIDADLEDALLLDIEIDALGIEELQALVEHLEKYYPHKLNLAKLNLSLLDFKRIDLRNLNLKGVDFTGVNFAGVSIVGVDLSACKITPEQIAQALGRQPSQDELVKILAPKKKKSDFKGVDVTSIFFDDGKEFGVWDFTKDKGISIDTLVKVGKKVFSQGKKPQAKEDAKNPQANEDREVSKIKSHNDELRKIIEERKQKELEARRAMKENIERDRAEKAKINVRHNVIRNRSGDRGR